LLAQWANMWLDYGRDPTNATTGGYDYGHRAVVRSSIERLYRAATGEVVNSAALGAMDRLAKQWRIEARNAEREAVGLGDIYAKCAEELLAARADLVRRDKEGV
jgi:hypothetical protein